jgi:hypothetical protein
MDALDVNEWLHLIRREYIDTFVADGGASVKFAVPLDDPARSSVLNGLRREATEAGYLYVVVNAAETKVHLMQDLFHRVAEQVPWANLARRVNVRAAEEAGYTAPNAGDGGFADALATANTTDVRAVRLLLNPRLMRDVFQNRGLARDFRVAMLHLCQADLAGGDEGRIPRERLTDWLTGLNKHVSAVKVYQIFSRITRTNARPLIESLSNWVRQAGSRGLVLVLDLAQLAVPRRTADGGLFYTTAALLDAYEVLRQFIDALDRLTGCLVVAVASPAFLDLEPTGRGLGRYEALKFRVYDEVRARERPNPLAALARLRTPGSQAEVVQS